MTNSDQGPASHEAGLPKFDLTEARAILDDLRSALSENLTSALLTPSILKKCKRPNKRTLRLIPVTNSFSMKMRDRVGSNIINAIYEARSSADGLAEFAFSNASQDRILALHIDDFDALRDWLSQLPEVSSLQNFEKGDNFENYVDAVFSYISIPGYQHSVYAVADWSTSMFLQKAGVSAYFKKDTNNYDYMNNENIITLTDQIDFFIVGNYVFIKNNEKFERIVSFRRVTEGRARQAFDYVIEQVPIKNAEEVFKGLSKGARNVKKLAKIAGMPHVNDLDVEDIQKLIEKEGLPLRIENGEIVVDPNDREQTSALLNVVMDAFVQSQMTQYRYLVHDAELRG